MSSLACDTMSHKGMPPAGLLRGFAPGDPFLDSRSPFSPIYSWEVMELGDIPQSEEEKAFAAVDLTQGCRSGTYQEVSAEHAGPAKKNGSIVS